MSQATQIRTEQFYLEAAAAIIAAEQQAGPHVVVSEPTAIEWAARNAKIVTPGVGIDVWEPYEYQTDLLNDTSPRRLVLKARQTGLSTAIALEALYYALHRPHDRTLFVSRNENLAGLLIQYVQVAIAGLEHPPKLVAESQSKLVFPNGSEILSLPANPATGRGYPASRVYIDEAAFIAYAELIMQGIMPTLSAGGQMTVQSTAKGRNNLFFRLWSGLEGGDWSRHTVPWQACPRYTEAWATEMRASMTRQAFAEEYDLDFLLSGDAVFDPDDIAAARIGWNPDPKGCSRIITAWDIGRRRDHTVGITIGLRGEVWHEVAYERCLVPYPAIQDKIDARTRKLGGTTHVESNGVGDPVLENLMTKAEPFVTTAKSKVQAIQALQLLLQKRQFKFGSEQLGLELGLYEWDDGGLIQDSVMAAAIAAFIAVPPPSRLVELLAQTRDDGKGDPPKMPDPLYRGCEALPDPANLPPNWPQVKVPPSESPFGVIVAGGNGRR